MTEHVIEKRTPATVTRRIRAAPFETDPEPVVGPERVQRVQEDTTFVCECGQEFIESADARRHLRDEAEIQHRGEAEA